MRQTCRLESIIVTHVNAFLKLVRRVLLTIMDLQIEVDCNEEMKRILFGANPQ